MKRLVTGSNDDYNDDDDDDDDDDDYDDYRNEFVWDGCMCVLGGIQRK